MRAECGMLAPAPAGFECSLAACPREFAIETTAATLRRLIEREAGRLPAHKRRRRRS